MKLRDPKTLHATAGACLAESGDMPKKLVLIHTGAALLLSLLLSVVSYLLRRQIDSTAGLGGLQDRAVLQTAVNALQVLQLLVMPFWQYGYTCATIDIYRKNPVGYDTLLGGFRRFGPILRITLIQGLIYGFIAIAASYAAGYVFMLTPWGSAMMGQIMEMMSSSSTLDYAAMQEVILSMSNEYILPLTGITAAILLVAAVPVWYRYRMAEYLLMENPTMGAINALRISRAMMRRNCISLFKVDLHFWWFYALELLAAVICYGDLLLEYAGISLPWSPDISYFLFLVLYAAGQLGLYYWKKNEISLTYMAAFDCLMPRKDHA